MREQRNYIELLLQEYLLSSFSLDMIDLAAVRRLFIRVVFKSYEHGAAAGPFAVADRPGLSLKCSSAKREPLFTTSIDEHTHQINYLNNNT